MEPKDTEQNSLGSTTADEVFEIRPRNDGDGFDLISDRLRRGPIWYAGPDAVREAVAYAKYRSRSRSHRAIIRVLDHSGTLIRTYEFKGNFGWFSRLCDTIRSRRRIL